MVQGMSTVTVPPPIVRRSVIEGPKRVPFRIRSGDFPVCVIRAETAEEAVAAFTAGRPPLPEGALPLRAYLILDLGKSTRR
jgi:hypothetical protein